ncbi:hypothetical protein FBR02_05485 [Anaerolineae bacterium CFX9]|nr:hypothetical protein [Anaerolineae bacterium CFX9]
MANELIVAIFPSRAVLTRALDRLMEQKHIRIERAAIVAKAHSGEIVILDDEIGPDEGGIAGGTLGASMAALGMVQLGALAIPGVGAIIAIGAGALVGALVGQITGRVAANLIDTSFKNHQIEGLAMHLEAGRPALVLEVRNAQSALPALRRELKPFRAEVVEPLDTLTAATGR